MDFFYKKLNGFASRCKECSIIFNKLNYNKFRDKHLKQKKEYYLTGDIRQKKLQYNKKYYSKNREKILIQVAEYRQKNLRFIKKRVAISTLKRYHSDINFKIKMNLSRRMRTFFKKNGKRTISLIGCSIDNFKKHIESKFTSGMSWENYGRNGWHIDHIRPCASFDLTDPKQQTECFHYTNLQPLWEKDNIKKSAFY